MYDMFRLVVSVYDAYRQSEIMQGMGRGRPDQTRPYHLENSPISDDWEIFVTLKKMVLRTVFSFVTWM